MLGLQKQVADSWHRAATVQPVVAQELSGLGTGREQKGWAWAGKHVASRRKPPGKDGSVSRGKRKQKKSPEPSTPREWRVPELYPPLPGPGEDMLDPLNALPPYPRREVPHSTQPEEGGTLSSPPHTRGGTR